jgi:hypothetical protein
MSNRYHRYHRLIPYRFETNHLPNVARSHEEISALLLFKTQLGLMAGSSK